MGLGSLIARDAVNITTTVTNQSGTVLSSDVFTVVDGLLPSWDSTPYRGAMNLPGAWRAAIIAADLLGSLPWEAYGRGPGNVPVLAAEQPALLTQPAPPDPLVTTVSSWGLDYIWHGNAVSVKAELDEAGDVPFVVPVPIGNVAVAWARGRGDEIDRSGRAFRRGERIYRIANTLYRADEVVHLKGPCEPGALRGLGALEVHLNGAIRTGLELQRQASNLDISGVPTGTLKITAPDMTKEEAAQAKSAWLRAQRDRTVAVLNDVTEFTPLAWNPTEAQLLDARKFSLHEIALIVGVPLYFLGVETSNRTYSNVEQEGIVLTRFHLAGAIRRVEWGFSSCMRPGRFVQADLSDALRADTLTRYQAWQLGLVSGFLTPNEVRNRENLKPMPGGDALVAPVKPDANGADPADGPDVGHPEIGEDSKQQGRALAAGLPAEPMAAGEFAVVLEHWLELEARAKGAGPTGANLHDYWTKGPGRAKWNTWTELYTHLLKYLSPERAKRTAAQWFHDVKGFWPGSRKNRGRHSFDPDQPRDPDGKWGAGSDGTNMLGMPLGPRTADTGGTVGGAPRVSAATPPQPPALGTDAAGRPIETGVHGGQGVRRPDIPIPDGMGGGGKTGIPPYRLNKRKYCPNCGGKAQDPQMEDPRTSLGVNDWSPDGRPLYAPGYEPEVDDEPYHDKSDPEYKDD
jgi:phage portal protein BeeE